MVGSEDESAARRVELPECLRHRLVVNVRRLYPFSCRFVLVFVANHVYCLLWSNPDGFLEFGVHSA